MEYVDSIIKDIQWLGFDWADRLFFASDYYEQYISMPCSSSRQERPMYAI